MTKCDTAIAISATSVDPAFSSKLKVFREHSSLSPLELAAALGVSKATIYRWENGTARPTKSVVKRLEEIGAPVPKADELNTRSIPRLKAAAAESSVALNALRDASVREFRFGDSIHECVPAPYVRNGPPDQTAFHRELIDLQQQGSTLLEWDDYRRRLALVESVEGVTTAQSKLEARRETAVSWNSNYGAHGWHRYVGRFPPHVVRAFLNSWGMSSSDLVLDPFAGSGTTLVECRLLGIPAIGIEVCPLSAMISRTKSQFPTDTNRLEEVASKFEAFYTDQWSAGRNELVDTASVFARHSQVETFANVEKWFTVDALFGVALTIEFASTISGYERDFVLTALSSKMRSIGNVDVDVVRAEYRKSPRENVDVLKLMRAQLKRMIVAIKDSSSTHEGLIEIDPTKYEVKHSSVFDAELERGSVSAIVTSPPYGVESLSYLRTHLLSYRSLKTFLGADPYERHDGFIGSEYLDGDEMRPEDCEAWNVSKAFRDFFGEEPAAKDRTRHAMMVKFFDDLMLVGAHMRYWLKDGGHVAFVVGNKRLGERIIPTDQIVSELFAARGLKTETVIEHKLKTNNSNSQVPWQEKTIQNEFIMTFRAV